MRLGFSLRDLVHKRLRVVRTFCFTFAASGIFDSSFFELTWFGFSQIQSAVHACR